jgi:hypothetical protein
MGEWLGRRVAAAPYNTTKRFPMQENQSKSIFSRFNDISTNEASVKKPAAEMRPLSDEELRAVAGGPEVEVDDGNG